MLNIFHKMVTESRTCGIRRITHLTSLCYGLDLKDSDDEVATYLEEYRETST
jgi:hypothetical protein